MVIRKPIKRVRTLFSDFVKGNNPQYLANEVQNSYPADYPMGNNQHRHKKILEGRKGNQTDMSIYMEVPIKHMLFGGEMTCLKDFCTGDSDMKVGCSWAQFKGDHIDALEVIFSALKYVSYIRQNDHRAGTTYMIFINIKDANNLMSTKLVYDDKPIDLYQTVKIEEDITVVNIQNFRDVGIELMAKLILKELGPWCEIKYISAWRRFDNNQYLPYGIKVLVKKNNMKVSLPSFLDHENGKINILYKSCKEACSYCKEAGHWKSDDHRSSTQNKAGSKSKIINDTEVSTNYEAAAAKTSTINRQRGAVGLKKSPASSINAVVILSSSTEKVSSGDDTESDGSDDDNHQPIIKRTAKSTINSDDFSDISVDSDMSFSMETKKEFISSKLSPKNNSDGYSPLSVHALMAAKAIMGQKSEQAFKKYVTNVDKAPPGSSIAAIEPESDA
ncbi:hypothetical protein AYI70_g2377 [Smittium culicis]|uniref:Uncharacterized protein n=1 Tax=Smittium culicis TaxID=133412 RepID=A0A1R1Y8Q5_9FUNG|nr:hypothetical protein AYI70_g2377 [Smittium culicis]